MNKLLGSTLALALLVPAQANAELFKNLKVSGKLDVQATSSRNVTDFVTHPNSNAGGSGPGAASSNQDRQNHTITRTMATADWDLLEDVHARATLVKGAHSAGTPRTYGAAVQSVATLESDLLIQEASIRIDKLADLLDTTIGRQFFGEPGDLIVYYGPRDNYGQVVDAVDAFRFDWKGEHMTAVGLAGTTSDTAGAGTTGHAITDIRGLILSCNKHENVKPTLYIWNRVDRGAAASNTGGSGQTPGGKNDFLYVVGAKVKATLGNVWVNGEFAKNFGENRSLTAPGANFAESSRYKGWALLADAGIKQDIDSVGAFTGWGQFGYGSGRSRTRENQNENFTAINTDYRPGGIYGYYDSTSGEVLGNGVTNFDGASSGLTNRIVIGAGAKVTPAALSKLTTGVSVWRYMRTRNQFGPDGRALLSGTTFASANTSPSRNIGTEADLSFDWKHSDNVNVGVVVGTFQPGRYIADLKGANAAINPALMGRTTVSVRF